MMADGFEFGDARLRFGRHRGRVESGNGRGLGVAHRRAPRGFGSKRLAQVRNTGL